jgi:hyperosmotically inducible protein
MGRALRTLGVVVGILAILSGCRAMTGRSAGTHMDDASITASVKSKLVADRASNLVRVDVDSTNGTVYLNGTVDTPEQKARAEQLAWQAKGVKTVVNNLEVVQQQGQQHQGQRQGSQDSQRQGTQDSQQQNRQQQQQR